MKSQDKFYLPGLNSLRFFAALAVVVHHIEQFKSIAGLNNIWKNTLIQSLGPNGVSCFFVLSGFLITYLLLVEYQLAGEIAVKQFYIRRVLRIWPLYYLIVLWSFFVLPHVSSFGYQFLPPDQHIEVHFGAKLVLFLLILPNYALIFYPFVIGASQCWSIGVEEQFYLIWPVLVRKYVKRVFGLLCAVVLLKVGLNKVFSLLASHHLSFHGVDASLISDLVLQFKIEYMAIGAIGAYWMFHEKIQAHRWILGFPAKSMALLAIGTMMLYPTFPAKHLLEPMLFTLFIVQVASGSQAKGRWWSRVLDYFGVTSYGIYMWHPTVIVLLLTAVTASPKTHAFAQTHPRLLDLVLYPSAIALTLGLSALSYVTWESPFLRLKRRFTVVQSAGTPSR